jgi:lipoprotein-anchoring transpeptidase ErfK/SrfK
MNDRLVESREALSYAREALKNGAMAEARQWAERSAELAPQSEDPWLILAAVASPRESVEYIRKALELSPESPRAKKGMEWALHRLGETPVSNAATPEVKSKDQEKKASAKTPKKRNVLLPILLGLTGLAVLVFAAWSAVNSPVLASILNSFASAPASQPAERQPFAQVDIAKPSAANTLVAQIVKPTATRTAIATPTVTVTAQPEIAGVIIDPTATQRPAVAAPTSTKTVEVVVIPAGTATVDSLVIPTNTIGADSATSTPEATSVPGIVLAEIVVDTPTPEGAAATIESSDVPISFGNGEHWIDVDLSQQRVYAYEGDTVVNSFLVSTGTWQTPTVTGRYNIWIKLRSTTMSGPGYYLTNVPFTMYFYKGYGLHGTYWHNNFGTPMSHGCVNLATPDAEWLYNFSSVGTVVNVHY